MTRIDKLPTWLALAMSCGALADQATDLPYRNPGLPVEQRVADLLGRMTLDEKLGQMVMGCLLYTSDAADE